MPATTNQESSHPEIDAKLYDEICCGCRAKWAKTKAACSRAGARGFTCTTWFHPQHLVRPRGDGCLRAIGCFATVTCCSVSPKLKWRNYLTVAEVYRMQQHRLIEIFRRSSMVSAIRALFEAAIFSSSNRLLTIPHRRKKLAAADGGRSANKPVGLPRR